MSEAVIDGKGVKIEEFCKWTEGSGRFEIICLIEDNQKFVVADSEKKDQIIISVEEVENAPLSSIIKVFLGEQEPISLRAYSRVVGYYSRIDAWNNSKISELAGRARGSYGQSGYIPKNQKERLENIDKMKKAFGN